jgi:DNA-binding IclR family transcriptional regulator
MIDGSSPQPVSELRTKVQAVTRAGGWVSSSALAATLGKPRTAIHYLAGKLVEEGLIKSGPRGYCLNAAE